MNIVLVLFNICAMTIATAMCSFAGASDGLSHFQEGAGQLDPLSATTANRVRREAGNMCCNVETPSGVDAYSRKAKVTYNDCAKEVGPGIPKIVECIARKYKMVDEADNLSETGIKAVFSDFPLNEYQKTVKDISITVCVEKTKTISAAELIKILRQFYFCILQALMNACPDDDQNNSERCQDFRNGKFQ